MTWSRELAKYAWPPVGDVAPSESSFELPEKLEENAKVSERGSLEYSIAAGPEGEEHLEVEVKESSVGLGEDPKVESPNVVSEMLSHCLWRRYIRYSRVQIVEWLLVVTESG